ncbi:signal peptidase I [Breznakia sp. PF5-3]|uniref:signal peptidase I n=1 Tax=unclassified Breznakia TaxID=2623764 RepID=UPI002404C8CB|nr:MULTISPECIES: signal peptidase I [unclassified Breznakia]MDL2276745.1 signal peptidase I [Breznakia sp. OttesenSCG-928-G09]MDF9825293.1 signal peptidase I [Breznakia sp. PM6-1]MDF9836161.1 signal peptidase I [Breznakia sp. PF5-3]MDF9837393.1 signal peptidase I [Breznakia sp. PFB2-8]MDF9859328.1 signal peptidase I [Breznakia sp. PH5-24]
MLAIKEKIEKQRDPNKQPTVLQDILYLFIKIIAIIGIFILLFTLIFGIHRNANADMDPAIKDGDLILYYRFDKNYTAKDLVMYEYDDTTYVSRVVAVAGDQVDINEEGLIINGSLQQEYDIYTDTLRYATDVEFPLEVKTGEIFVLGDNREQASDSRIFGSIKIKNTFGKVFMIIRRRNL